MKYYSKENIKRFIAMLPDRRGGKRGPSPIPKETLVKAFLLWLRTGCSWREVPHSATVRRYFFECQRRGILFKNIPLAKNGKSRLNKVVIDATNIDTYKGSPMSRYSGKYHNYCIKLTLIITEHGHIVDFNLSMGSYHDSKIFDFMLKNMPKFPYEILADKGFENYERRRALKESGCQLRIEQKNYKKNKKRGPRFLFTKAHKDTRTSIERYFAYIKSFKALRYLRFRKISTLKLAVLSSILFVFVLSI